MKIVRIEHDMAETRLSESIGTGFALTDSDQSLKVRIRVTFFLGVGFKYRSI